jgi:hypothetical protein
MERRWDGLGGADELVVESPCSRVLVRSSPAAPRFHATQPAMPREPDQHGGTLQTAGVTDGLRGGRVGQMRRVV